MSPRVIASLCFSALAGSACLGVDAPTVGVEHEMKVQVLQLDEAIDAALLNNLGLITARYAPANEQDSVMVEAAQFDIELFAATSLAESQAAASGSSLDSATLPESETRRAGVGLEKRFSTGASVTVDSNIRRYSSNNNAVRNPDYSTDVGLSVRQPLLQGAGATVNLAPIVRAQTVADRSLYILRSDVLDVISEVEIAYWNVAFAGAVRDLIGSSLELAESLLEENRARERLGLVTPLEVLQAETELVNQQEDMLQADRLIEDNKDALRRAMGTVSFLADLDADLTVNPLPAKLPKLRPLREVVHDTLDSDADAQAQELAVEVQRINKILAQDKARVRFDLTSRVSYLGRDTDGWQGYQGAYNADGYNWNVGLEVRLPWGLREARARVRQADRNIDREAVEWYDIKQQKALLARNSWRAVDTGVKQLEVTQRGVELNQEAFEQERARYGAGLVSYRGVLEAQRDFDQARRQNLSAVIESLRAAIRLSRVDGSILERNGFTWETVDALAESPNLTEHPLGEEILEVGN